MPKKTTITLNDEQGKPAATFDPGESQEITLEPVDPKFIEALERGATMTQEQVQAALDRTWRAEMGAPKPEPDKSLVFLTEHCTLCGQSPMRVQGPVKPVVVECSQCHKVVSY